MLNITLDGDMYVINIILPKNKFNDELLKKVVGLTYTRNSEVCSTFRTKQISEVHKLSEKVLQILKLLDYGT